MRRLATIAIASSLPFAASAAPVDLTGWIENGYKGNNGAGTWTVQAGNDSVRQTSNGQPTVFFEPGANAQGTALSGTIRKYLSSDDDFIGFVLGYQDGELNSTAADFWLIDWKQANQSGGLVGLALSHVTGNVNAATGDPFWNHDGIVNEVARATNLGSTGYANNQAYTFELTFTDTLIEVFVDSQLEISYSGNFSDGAFGFYNYSQAYVEYAGITEDVLPDPDPNTGVVPLPAGLPLLLAGMGAFGLVRRRQG